MSKCELNKLSDICACEYRRSRFSSIVKSSAEMSVFVKTDKDCGEMCAILCRNGYCVRASPMCEALPENRQWVITFYDPETLVWVNDDAVSEIEKATRAGMDVCVIRKDDTGAALQGKGNKDEQTAQLSGDEDKV